MRIGDSARTVDYIAATMNRATVPGGLRPRHALCALALALLTGCGGGPGHVAAEACRKAITERVTGKSISLDLEAMAKGYAPGAAGAGTVSGAVVFDQGLPIEARQTFTCRVQFDPAMPDAEPAITGLEFVW